MKKRELKEVVDKVVAGDSSYFSNLKLNRWDLREILNKVYEKGLIPESRLARTMRCLIKQEDEPSLDAYFFVNKTLISKGLIPYDEFDVIDKAYEQLAYVKRNLDHELKVPSLSSKSTVSWWNSFLNQVIKARMYHMITSYIK